MRRIFIYFFFGSVSPLTAKSCRWLALPVPAIISLPIAGSLGHFVGPPPSSLRFSRACKISTNLQTFFASIFLTLSVGKGYYRLLANKIAL